MRLCNDKCPAWRWRQSTLCNVVMTVLDNVPCRRTEFDLKSEASIHLAIARALVEAAEMREREEAKRGALEA